MPGGRPSKYNQEMQDKADDYLETYKDDDQVVPSNVGLSLRLNINESTIYEWDRTYDAFSNTLAKIKATQHVLLVSKGLTTEFNSNITKLMLANHGFSEKTETKHSGAMGIVDLSDKTDEELEAILNGS